MAIFSKAFIFTLFFSLGFYITYNQVFNDFPSDIMAHINHVNQFTPGHEVEVAYPMWHLLVYKVSNFFNITFRQSAVIVTSLVIVALAITIFTIVKFSLKYELSRLSENKKEHLYLVMTAALMIMTAVYVPFFNKNLYVGQANCAVWHNVTLLMVKPFAFFSLYMTIMFFETKKIKWFLSSTLVILLSIYAKPSFIISFLPAVFIFFVLFCIRQTEHNNLQVLPYITNMVKRFKQEISFLVILSILSSIVLWGQYTATYKGATTSTIVFDFLGVWSLYTPNVFGSLLLTFLFPIAVFLLVDKKESNTYLLAGIMTIISVILFAVFAEEGPRYAHGNFGWSLQVSVHIFFTMSLIVFVKNYTHLQNWKKYILSITLSLHIISGVFYLIKILKGLSYA